MQFKAKVKSFKELMSMAYDVNGTSLVFIENGHDVFFNNEMRVNCGKEIVSDDCCGKDYLEYKGNFYRLNWLENIVEIKDEVWKPKHSQEFYTISSIYSKVIKDIYSELLDKPIVKFHNCYETKEKAELALNHLKIQYAMIKYKIDNDNVSESCMYWIGHDGVEASICRISGIIPLNMIRFSTIEKAEGCIQFLKKEGLIRDEYIKAT